MSALQSKMLFDMNSFLFTDREQTPVQQNVYITADFPAAQYHREIELAFENLTNRASQYLFTSR